MLIIGIMLLILSVIGIAYILTILFFAMKVQHQEYYSAEKVLKQWDFCQVEGMDLGFVEYVTNELNRRGFRWSGDYKLEDKDKDYIKLLKHHNASAECYVRYLIHNQNSTVASVFYCKIHPKKTQFNGIVREINRHYFMLETALKTEEHLHSIMVYESKENFEYFKEDLKILQDSYNVYTQEGELLEMVEDHIQKVSHFKKMKVLDTKVMVKPLKEVLQEWWHRTYALKNEIYCYKEAEDCYKLTLVYCIKAVLCQPFFRLFKEI